MPSTPESHRPSRAPRVAEAAVCGADAARRVVRAVRPDAGGVQQRRGACARRLYFNQASPSAYLRGHTRAVPLALAYMRSLELLGARVLNGADVFALELSKSAQATLLRTLGIDCPRSITFNDPRALRAYAAEIRWPALLKPDQGGSGARIQVVDSLGAGRGDLRTRSRRSGCPTICSCCRSISRTIPSAASSASSFSAASCCTRCASSPTAGSTCARRRSATPTTATASASCRRSGAAAAPPVEFYPFPEVPAGRRRHGAADRASGGLDVGGIEYLETVDGRRVFYDINANSNLRPSVAEAFGFDPFERVVDFLAGQLARR